MTQLKIHWWNMAFHKRVAISVQISAWEGGNVVYASAPGTSYSLDRLPIGSIITKASDSLYNITDSSSTVLWSITLTADSWYVIGGIKLNGQLVSSTPVILNDWDILNPIFTMITMRITFYNGGLWGFYNELTGKYIDDWWYADVPRADELRFKSHSTTNWIIEIYKDWDWRPAIDYTYNWQQAHIIAASALAQVQSVEFVTDGGNTYTFPALWGLQSWYQYLDGSTFAFQKSLTPCEFAKAQDIWFNPGTFFDYFQQNAGTYFQSRYWCSDFQILDCAPRNFNYVLSSDLLGEGGEKTWMCWCAISVRDRDYMKYTWEWYVIYNNVKGSTYFNFINSDWNLSWLNVPQWSSTNLTPISTNTLGLIFEYDDTNQIDYWKQSWSCADECELANTLIQLLNY